MSDSAERCPKCGELVLWGNETPRLRAEVASLRAALDEERRTVASIREAFEVSVEDDNNRRAALESRASRLAEALRRIKRESDDMHADGRRLEKSGRPSPWFVTDNLDDAIEAGAALSSEGERP